MESWDGYWDLGIVYRLGICSNEICFSLRLLHKQRPSTLPNECHHQASPNRATIMISTSDGKDRSLPTPSSHMSLYRVPASVICLRPLHRRFYTVSCVLRRQAAITSDPNMASKPRRFAPLNPDAVKKHGEDLPKLKGIVFDVDGTLCKCRFSCLYYKLYDILVDSLP